MKQLIDAAVGTPLVSEKAHLGEEPHNVQYVINDAYFLIFMYEIMGRCCDEGVVGRIWINNYIVFGLFKA